MGVTFGPALNQLTTDNLNQDMPAPSMHFRAAHTVVAPALAAFRSTSEAVRTAQSEKEGAEAFGHVRDYNPADARAARVRFAVDFDEQK